MRKISLYFLAAFFAFILLTPNMAEASNRSSYKHDRYEHGRYGHKYGHKYHKRGHHKKYKRLRHHYKHHARHRPIHYYNYTYGPVPRYCREYQGHLTIGGIKRYSYGTACLQPDGIWKVMN